MAMSVNKCIRRIIRSGLMRVPVAGLAVFVLIGPLFAQDFTENVTYDSYIVDGSTLAEVADDMSANGPNGYWAWASWQVTWTADCEISIEGNITLPELAEDHSLSDDDAEIVETMLEALEFHEDGHIDFARGYAADVAAANCDVDDSLLDLWLQNERDYDAETDHGRTQGAYL